MTELYFFYQYTNTHVRTDCILNSLATLAVSYYYNSEMCSDTCYFVSEFYCLRKPKGPGFVTHGNIMERTKTDMEEGILQNAF